jgi:hypothetical protein
MELRRKLLELYREMPSEGRVSYNSLNMAPHRPKVKEIINYILKSDTAARKDFDGFCADIVRRDKQTAEVCISQKIEDVTVYMREDKYINDMYRRLGDQVIWAALEVKRRERRGLKNAKSELAKKRIEKRHRGYLFERSIRLSADINDSAIRFFEEYCKRLKENEFDRLIADGEIELE